MTFDIHTTPRKNSFLDQIFTVNGTIVSTVVLMTIAVTAERNDLFPFVPEGFAVGLYYLLIGLPILLAIAVYRSFWYRKETSRRIGKIEILPDTVTVSTGEHEEQYPMGEIARMDVRFSYGGESPFRNNENIHKFKILRLSGFFRGRKLEYVVSNLDAEGKAGALTTHLEAIRKTSLDLHRKIQLWERYD